MSIVEVEARLNKDDIAGAIQCFSKIKFDEMKKIGYRLGMGTGYSMKKTDYVELAKRLFPRLTKSGRDRTERINELCAASDRFDDAAHSLGFALGKIAIGGFDISRRDEAGILEYEAEIEAAKAEFQALFNAGEWSGEVVAYCSRVCMAIAEGPNE